MGELKIRVNPDNADKLAAAKDRPKVKAVVSRDDIVSTKRPVTQRIGDNLLATTIKNSMGDILKTVVIPGVQNAILDSLSILFFDKKANVRGREKNGHQSYGSYYKTREERVDYSRRSRERDREKYYEIRNNASYKNIILRRMDDAKKIVDDMQEMIRAEGYATISDLFRLLDLDSEFTDQDWGWTRPGDIGIRIVNDGYLIDVNDAIYIRER